MCEINDLKSVPSHVRNLIVDSIGNEREQQIQHSKVRSFKRALHLSHHFLGRRFLDTFYPKPDSFLN